MGRHRCRSTQVKLIIILRLTSEIYRFRCYRKNDKKTCLQQTNSKKTEKTTNLNWPILSSDGNTHLKNLKHDWHGALIYEISGRNSTNEREIRAKISEELIKLRKEHFENLLGHPPVIHQHPLHIETNDFTEDALINSIELLKTNKSGLTRCYSCGSTKNVLLTKKNSV